MAKYAKDDHFFPYFGFTNKMVPPVNTYGQQDEENYDMVEISLLKLRLIELKENQ